MLFLILFLYLVAIVFLLISKCVDNISCGRLLKRIAFTIINSVCYSLILFCIPNIVTAIAIEVKEGTIGNFTYPFSTILLVTAILMILVSNLIFLWKS